MKEKTKTCYVFYSVNDKNSILSFNYLIAEDQITRPTNMKVSSERGFVRMNQRVFEDLAERDIFGYSNDNLNFIYKVI